MPGTSSPRVPVVRPRLKDGITPLWRDGATIQPTDPEAAFAFVKSIGPREADAP